VTVSIEETTRFAEPREFTVVLDERTLDQLRTMAGWLIGPPEIRKGVSDFYFAANEALGYLDDPQSFRGISYDGTRKVTPMVTLVEARPVGDRERYKP
jgi:hypothetical protein